MQRLKGEEEEKLRKKQEEEELERKRKEEERERRRLKEEEERKKREAAEKKAEQERIKKEEEKKRKEEEKKRKEEQKRKQEEEKRRQEEEKKRQEEEKKKQEEERKRAEQAKRQAEALKRLQEQQQQQVQARAAVKPTVPAWTAPETIAISASLTEIQKTERKQQQQLREQQLIQLLKKQQQESQERNNNNNNKSGSSLNLKWADTKKPQARVKSLAEIQAEEQEQLAKQLEREKAERMAQAKEVPLPVASSIWANPNLTWNTPQNTSSVWGGSTATGGGNSGGGFWDDVTPAVSAKLTKPTNKSKTPNSDAGNNTPNKPINVKNRAKKEEMNVLKLFEQQPKQDEFYNWCSKTLSTMQSSVDIPTFVQFLREIEHPLEIQEYIRIYLGEGKEATDFASQFIERRSRAKTGEPQKRTENTSASTTNHFQEVKGKNKKVKKGKMMRVDNRILGFNVTASQDRFNVGDRDYGENI
uniref:GYF domain-containing protein n=2 Tax=Clastoptera arizonana TaxID=38151 RepID=A0A1B6D8W0_9HEMI